MNFLCHAMLHLDEPLVAAGTIVPDWLSVIDRKIRARGRHAVVHIDSDDDELALVARGITQHHHDDRWFHGTESFVTTNMNLAVQLRDRLPGDEGFRPTFVGHILIEMLLDRFWLEESRSLGVRFYQVISGVPKGSLQRCVNIITGRPTDRLADVVTRFVQSEFLFDYLDDERLLWRLNQVMRRVGLAELPRGLLDWLPEARQQVRRRRDMMLTPPGTDSPFPL